MNKLQPNRLNDNITKLQSSDDKMILLNLITQEYNKNIHYKIERDKFNDLIKNPQEIHESSESEELQESQEIHKSSSNYEIKNDLEFDTIYEEKNKPEEIIYYDPNQAKLKTVAKIMYSKNNLDKLIKKKKW